MGCFCVSGRTPARGRGHHVAIGATDLFREPGEIRCPLQDLAAGFSQRLALFQGQDAAKIVDVFLDELAPAAQLGPAFLQGHLAPDGQRRLPPAAMAARASLAVQRGTLPRSSPVAGLMTGSVAPFSAFPPLAVDVGLVAQTGRGSFRCLGIWASFEGCVADAARVCKDSWGCTWRGGRPGGDVKAVTQRRAVFPVEAYLCSLFFDKDAALAATVERPERRGSGLRAGGNSFPSSSRRAGESSRAAHSRPLPGYAIYPPPCPFRHTRHSSRSRSLRGAACAAR